MSAFWFGVAFAVPVLLGVMIIEHGLNNVARAIQEAATLDRKLKRDIADRAS